MHVVFDAMSRGYESQHNKWGMIGEMAGGGGRPTRNAPGSMRGGRGGRGVLEGACLPRLPPGSATCQQVACPAQRALHALPTLCCSQLLRQDGGRHLHPQAGPAVHRPRGGQGKPHGSAPGAAAPTAVGLHVMRALYRPAFLRYLGLLNVIGALPPAGPCLTATLVPAFVEPRSWARRPGSASGARHLVPSAHAHCPPAGLHRHQRRRDCSVEGGGGVPRAGAAGRLCLHVRRPHQGAAGAKAGAGRHVTNPP